MKQTTAVLLTIAAAALSGGCAGDYKPGTFVESHLPSDYGLDCNGILREISNLEIMVRHQTPKTDEWIVSGRATAQIRDARNRIQNLRGLGASKGCFNQQTAGAAESGAQQPAPKEKSRVIICNEGQTCVVE
ncbi:MAG: hypothetical protein ACR2QC_03100 [Gammaproteobacteria bacterium]